MIPWTNSAGIGQLIWEDNLDAPSDLNFTSAAPFLLQLACCVCVCVCVCVCDNVSERFNECGVLDALLLVTIVEFV